MNSGYSALGRLLIFGALAGAFILGLAGVVYMSLQGREVQVPEITGKNFTEGSKELESLGLRIKKRADRFSQDAPDTVIEQLPKPGETVKTGQLILVVVSKGSDGTDQKPESLKNAADEDDTEKIEEMISDKPKKNKNTASKSKKPDTSRDVKADDSETDTADGSSASDPNQKGSDTSKDGDDKSKETKPVPINRQPSNSAKKPNGNEPHPKPTIKP